MVVREDQYQHFKVGDVGYRYKSPKSLRDGLPCSNIPELLPDPLGLVVRINQAGHPLAALATRRGLHETQGVLQGAADSREIIDPGEQALLNVISLPGERSQMSAEDVSHQSWITSDLQLGKTGICRERLKAHIRSRRWLCCSSSAHHHTFPVRESLASPIKAGTVLRQPGSWFRKMLAAKRRLAPA